MVKIPPLLFYVSALLDVFVDMGGAGDFKVRGIKQDSRAERAKKFSVPTFPNVGYKQANISRGLLNILRFCCLVVALINIGRPTPMVL